MADDLTGKVWEIDTTGVKTAGAIYVERIAWKNASASGHTARVIDGEGKLIWEHFAPGAVANTSEPVGKIFEGLNVLTLSSGKLYITRR